MLFLYSTHSIVHQCIVRGTNTQSPLVPAESILTCMNCCALALYLGDVMIFFCMIRTAGFNRDTESLNADNHQIEVVVIRVFFCAAAYFIGNRSDNLYHFGRRERNSRIRYSPLRRVHESSHRFSASVGERVPVYVLLFVEANSGYLFVHEHEVRSCTELDNVPLPIP